MQWLKYKIVCNENENILLDKKVTYNAENLAIAEAEAYNGEFEIEEDGQEEILKEPLLIEHGGTGAKTLEDAAKNLGLAVENISADYILITEQQDKLAEVLETKVFKQGNVVHGSITLNPENMLLNILFYVNRNYLAKHIVIVNAMAIDAEGLPIKQLPVLFRYLLPNQFILLEELPSNTAKLLLNFSYIM